MCVCVDQTTDSMRHRMRFPSGDSAQERPPGAQASLGFACCSFGVELLRFCFLERAHHGKDPWLGSNSYFSLWNYGNMRRYRNHGLGSHGFVKVLGERAYTIYISVRLVFGLRRLLNIPFMEGVWV